MKPIYTADMLGHPVRFFRSPLPGEDLPWHSVDDLHKAMGLPRAVRNDHQGRIRQEWGQRIRSVTCDGKPVMIAPHWMGQGITGAHDALMAGVGPDDDDSDGPMFAAYCGAAKEANDILLLMLGTTPLEGVSRTIRAVMRVEGDGHVH